MNFNQFNLDSRLNDGIKREGYHTPTPIQLAAIPLALAGNRHCPNGHRQDGGFCSAYSTQAAHRPTQPNAGFNHHTNP